MQQARTAKHDVSFDATNSPTLRDLQAFCLVVDRRSFTAVARLLRESVPTVSRRVARVEGALGVQLIQRNARRVEPTDEGNAYRLELSQVFEVLEDANARVRGATAAPRGRLRITAPPAFGALLAPILARFGELHPDVSLEAAITTRLLDLDTEQLDAALRLSFGLPDSSLIAHRLLDVQFAFVASPNYLKRHAPPPRLLADLGAHRVLMIHENQAKWRAVRSPTVSALQKLRPFLASSDLNFIRDLALAGAGIALLPQLCVAAELESGQVVRVLGDTTALPKGTLYLLHRSGRVLPPKLRAFRDFMIEAVAKPARRGSRA